MHLIGCFIADESQYVPEVVTIVCQVIMEKLLVANHWQIDVALTALDTLNLISEFLHLVTGNTHALSKLVMVELSNYIDIQLQLVNAPKAYMKITKAYDTVTKWALVSDWIYKDYESQKIFIAIVSRGVAILDRDKSFASVIPFEKLKSGTPLNVELLSTSSSVSSSVASGLQSKKNNKMPSSQIKFFPKGSRLSQIQGVTSTGSKDGGVGLPTFAVLTAEIQIKGAADAAFCFFCNHLTHSSPEADQLSFTQVSSIWDELLDNTETIRKQEKLKQALPDSVRNGLMGLSGNALRYFEVGNRIIGYTERPIWLTQSEYSTPSLAITVRDSAGKFTWFGKFKYEEKKVLHNDLHPSVSTIIFLDVQSLTKQLFDESGEKIRGTLEANAKFGKTYNHKSFNDENIPTIESLMSEKNISVNINNETVPSQLQIEQLLGDHLLDSYTFFNRRNIDIGPLPQVELSNPHHVPQNFRLFLAEMGYLDQRQNLKIRPLVSSESFYTDLKSLDKTPE